MQGAREYRYTSRKRAGPFARGRQPRSIGEFDMLVEGNISLVVLHDVVAVQTVAVLVEIIFALGSRVFLGGKDRLANFPRVGRAGLVDRRAQHIDGVVRP